MRKTLSLSSSLSFFSFFSSTSFFSVERSKLLSLSSSSNTAKMCSAPMSQDELRRAIVGIQTDATIDESEKAARRQALLTGKWRPGDGASRFFFFSKFFSFNVADAMEDESPHRSLCALLLIVMRSAFGSRFRARDTTLIASLRSRGNREKKQGQSAGDEHPERG